MMDRLLEISAIAAIFAAGILFFHQLSEIIPPGPAADLSEFPSTEKSSPSMTTPVHIPGTHTQAAAGYGHIEVQL